MYCEHCKVKVDCATEVCPLCHEPIDGNGEKLPQAFPKANIKKDRRKVFSIAFITVTLVLTLICLVFNILYNPKFMWSIMVLVVLSYIYTLIRFSIFSQNNFRLIIFSQAIALTIVFFAIRLLTGTNHWVLIAWLPSVYFVTEIILAIYTIKTPKLAHKSLISILGLNLFGIIPLISALIFNLSVIWPSVAEAVFSGIMAIIALIIGRHNIKNELKKFFHQ